MFFFTVDPTADVATSGSANTLADHLRLLTGAADLIITQLDLTGKAANVQQLTAIEIDMIKYVTPSSVGSAIGLNPTDSRSPVADTTAFTGPTVGSTPKYQWSGGMNHAGVGGFWPTDPLFLRAIVLANGGGASGNIDLQSQTAGTIATNFHYTLTMAER